MLVECGFVKAETPDGRSWTFTPALGRIATLGQPRQIVELYADLHDPERAAEAARYVLASLCDQQDDEDGATPLIGWLDEALQPHPGAMPAAEQIIIARHLMQHGISGKARPGGRATAGGRYAEAFDAAEFIGLARVHLGMSSADAEALSMTELQGLLAIKFPDAHKARDVPTREEYREAMAAIKKARERRDG